MNLIELAAKRLEELRRAGAEIPERLEPSAPAPQPAAPADSPPPAAQPQPLSLPQSRRVDLDLEAITASGYVSADAPRSRIADEFRLIKRPLIANAMGRGGRAIPNGNLVMVTSAAHGEGKTFTAINLALSIAMELDHTVMLVDADVARPSLLRRFGLPPAAGLLDLLTESFGDFSQVLLKTNIDKLTLLPSGSPHARATELLASDAMAQLLNEMASHYPDRIIIFDSPPLLTTTEARVLASHMGQLVMVVQAERTAQSDVARALEAVDGGPVKLMVLNRAREASAGSYGYVHGR